MWKYLLITFLLALIYTMPALAATTEDVGVSALPIVSPIVTTDDGATNITEWEARLRGEVTNTGNEAPDVWVFWGETDGGTDPGSWSDNMSLGTKGQGIFYQDIDSLEPDTHYYYQVRAVNSAGEDWADCSAEFDTLPEGTIILAPTDFTVIDAGDTAIGDILGFSWTKGTGSYYTMVRSARELYPSDVTEGELIYYGTEATANSSAYALEFENYKFSAWGYWSDNISHSTEYATISRGGEAMEQIADSLNQIFELIFLITLFAFALWKKDVVLDTASGLVLIFIALSWVDNYTWLSVVLMVLGCYQFFNAISGALTSQGRGHGISQFKSWYNRIRGR